MTYLGVGDLARSTGTRAQYVEGKVTRNSRNRHEKNPRHHSRKTFFFLHFVVGDNRGT